MRPIQKFPPGHKMLTRTDCGGATGSDKIQSTGPTLAGACTVVSGAEQFYNYGTAAAPTGSDSTLEVDGQLRFYSLLDTTGQAYVVASLGKAAKNQAYTMMDVQLYNATRPSVGVAAEDDPDGSEDVGDDKFDWDPVKKSGTFLWQWPKTSTDGMVIGPMDAYGWCLDLRVYEAQPGALVGNKFVDATKEGDVKSDAQGVTIPDAVLRGQGIRLCAYTCDQDWTTNDGVNVPVVSLSPAPAPAAGPPPPPPLGCKGTIGCDGVCASGKTNDPCNVCGGTGSTCAGCDGVANSGKTEDACKV